MSDARLRELERRLRASGAVADEAAWLRERARSGELAPERLALAARLGHAAAGPPGPGLVGLAEVAAGLDVAGRMRAAVAVARQRLASWRAVFPNDSRPAGAIAAAEAWLRCPCRRHAQASAQAAVVAKHAADYWRYWLAGPRKPARAPVTQLAAEHAARLAAWACPLFESGQERFARWGDLAATLAALRADPGADHPFDPALGPVLAAELPPEADGAAALAAVGYRPVVEVLRRELVPWLLGVGDPVRSRGRGETG